MVGLMLARFSRLPVDLKVPPSGKTFDLSVLLELCTRIVSSHSRPLFCMDASSLLFESDPNVFFLSPFDTCFFDSFLFRRVFFLTMVLAFSHPLLAFQEMCLVLLR